jgi:hypothetical protein
MHDGKKKCKKKGYKILWKETTLKIFPRLEDNIKIDL